MIQHLINFDLPISLLSAFVLTQSVSTGNDGNCYLVGGCVRDVLLGRTPKDFDIVTNADMQVLQQAFENNGWDVKRVGDAFLVTVVSKRIGGVLASFDIANFRKESKETDGRRPNVVEVGTAEDDADRRDFTMNAIYWNPIDKCYWDRHNGMQDIQNKQIKFIGKPKDRITEDYLRVFRAYRFASTLGFTLHPKTLAACREMYSEAHIKTAPERVRQEIERMAL